MQRVSGIPAWMLSIPVVGANPSGDGGAGVIEVVKQRLVEEFVPHPAVEGLADANLHRLARSDEVPGDTSFLGPDQHRVRGELSTMVGRRSGQA